MDRELLVPRDAGLAGPMVVGAETVAALTAVAEKLPEFPSIEVVPPDEVVNGLGADAEFGVVHYDLVGTQTLLKVLDDEGGETAFNFLP